MKSSIALVLCFGIVLSGAAPDSRLLYPNQLFEAIKGGNFQIVQDLIKNRDVNAVDESGQTPLSYAVASGRENIVNLLMQNGAKPTDSLLHSATKYGYGGIVDALVQKGVNVNAERREGKTPLLLAIENGKDQIAEYFVNHGANVNAADSKGKTALHYAAEFGREKAVDLLLNRGADPNKADNEGKSPLHWAIKGKEQIVDFLIKKGANINSADNEGKTALHRALAQAGSQQIAKLLIERGADMFAKDKSGEIAANLAEANGFGGVVDLIKKNNGVSTSTYSGSGLLFALVFSLVIALFQ